MILWGFPPPNGAAPLLYDAPVSMALADELTRDEGIFACLNFSLFSLFFYPLRHARYHAEASHYGLQAARKCISQRRSRGERTNFKTLILTIRNKSLKVLLGALVGADAGKSLDPLLFFSRMLLSLPYRLKKKKNFFFSGSILLA